ncbi:Glutathione S-transferase omega-like 2 [Neolecta irregularis DAH-3]|uniref:Glutathione S-transferase omega-like 2 n=1 Tax=Neolecta irregularis (strain DAH-3) TaxID=1198029 RepID=A0A1U7LUP3_NEOID|nr:Glutathione S-transferase omega-like 2 [Neolecta irregularis DAH-3]|eukprot:OLL26231.1 Glutathione S-transferase omega-like 2 [Neolecta irregularis DAH-3]
MGFVIPLILYNIIITTSIVLRLLSSSNMSKITDWASKDGSFHRQVSRFRDWISSDPKSKFPAEHNRYHLYISYACPWATRTLIVRELKGLKDIISVDIVHWHIKENGWEFRKEDGATGDSLYGFTYLKDLYFKANADYVGRYTVPTLWDKRTETIVSNESSEIIRMMYTEFDCLVAKKYTEKDYYPIALRSQIDEMNDWIYDTVNNGVYKAGFATMQEVYEKEVLFLFKSLDRIEKILGSGKYLLGDQLTEADIRLFPTIIRFDPVYVQHFKCNIGMIRYNYPNINRWMKHLYYDIPGFKETTNFKHIKKHYTKSHTQINPHSITPVGPIPDIEPRDK